MNTIYSLIVNFTIFLQAATVFSQENWELAKDEEGIQIYLKDYEGSKIKQIKSVTTYDASIKTIINVLTDFNAYPKWAYNYKDTELLERVSDNIFIFYTIIMTPPIARDRDAVLQMTIEKVSETKCVFNIIAKHDYKEEIKGLVRMPKFDAKYVYEQTAENKISLASIIHTEPGGSLPAFLINRLITEAPFNSLMGIKDMIKRDKYQ